MESSELKRLVWRWSKGWIEESTLEYRLDQKIQELASEFHSHLENQIGFLRRFHLGSYIELFQEEKSSSLRNIQQREYEKAVNSLQKAERTLKGLVELHQELQRFLQIQQEVKDFQEKLQLQLFETSSTFQSLQILLNLTEKNVQEGKVGKAKLSLRICSEEFQMWQNQGISEEQEEKLLNEKWEEVSQEWNNWEKLGLEEQTNPSSLHEKKLPRIQKLIQEKYYPLATRLLDDFQQEIGAESLFYHCYSKAHSLSEKRKNEIIRDNSPDKPDYYDMTSRGLLESSLQENFNHLQELQSKIRKATQKE